MNTLLIDNYDSFTFNLEQCLKKAGTDVVTYRNDSGLSTVDRVAPDLIVLSPGPSTPQNAGMCMDLVKEYQGKYPIFGVCLGMQVIAEVYEMQIKPLDAITQGEILGNPSIDEKFYSLSYEAKNSDIIHGGASEIVHDGKTIFSGLPSPFLAGRYHSLGAYTFAEFDGYGQKTHLPLEVSATTESNNSPVRIYHPIFSYGAVSTPPDRQSRIVMGVRHKEYMIEGVQFHPESVLSMKDDAGMKLIENVVKYMGKI